MDINEKIKQWSINNPTAIALTNEVLYKELHYSLSKKQSSNCPFCKKNLCEHWNGLGWINPKE